MPRKPRLNPRCECTDPGCPCCHGHCDLDSAATLFRVDMDDRHGILMCDKCADDAMESGMFTVAD